MSRISELILYRDREGGLLSRLLGSSEPLRGS